MKRVVVTGMAGLCPIGQSWPAVEQQLRAGRNGVRHMAEWDGYQGLNARLAAPVSDFELPEHYTRKRIRGMGRVARLATRASELALEDAGVLNDPVVRGGRAGVAYGSSSGSPPALCEFAGIMMARTAGSLKANSYIHMMPHTTAVNVGLFLSDDGTDYPVLQCLHLGQPWHWVCLRSDPPWRPDPDDRGRRGRTERFASGGVRCPAGRQRSQRRPGHNSPPVRRRS